MSTARSPNPQGYGLAGLRMSAEDYLAVGQSREQYELVGGVVLMSPSPRPRHWKVIHEILKQLGRFEDAGGIVDVYAETDLKIDEFSVLRPDICGYARAGVGGGGGGGPIPERLDAAPDLVVEVLSPGAEAIDLITKRDLYEKMGVREYWVVDPADGRVRAWRLEQGRFIESLVSGSSHASVALPGFALDLQSLLRLAQHFARPE